jgi:hypothetical protein
MNVLRKGDPRTKEGDDYPARLYVTFEHDPSRLGLYERSKAEAVRILYGEYPPGAVLNYIWESRAPIGSTLPNAWVDRARMIVVESGEANLGRWIEERRNVLEDFRRVFGEEPPAITGVAIMTDTDGTGESATAFYGDILFVR